MQSPCQRRLIVQAAQQYNSAVARLRRIRRRVARPRGGMWRNSGRTEQWWLFFALYYRLIGQTSRSSVVYSRSARLDQAYAFSFNSTFNSSSIFLIVFVAPFHIGQMKKPVKQLTRFVAAYSHIVVVRIWRAFRCNSHPGA